LKFLGANTASTTLATDKFLRADTLKNAPEEPAPGKYVTRIATISAHAFVRAITD